LKLLLWIIGITVAGFLAGQGIFMVADWRERSRFGVRLTAERGQQVGNRVGLGVAVVVFLGGVLWLEVGSQVFTAALVAGFAYMFCYAPIAGSAKGRASRVKAERDEAEQERRRLQN
jgi:hypothetical protein